MRRRDTRRNNQQGAVLVLVLVLVVVTTLSLIAYVDSSTQARKVAGIQSRTKSVTDRAYSALQIALVDHIQANWTDASSADTLVGDYYPPNTSETVVSIQKYVDAIAPTPTPPPLASLASVLYLEATVSAGVQTSVVRGFYEITSAGSPFPPQPGALGVCGVKGMIEKKENIHGEDYNPPSDACVGSPCVPTLSGNPATAGMAYNSANTTVTGSGGVPTGSPSVSSSANPDCTGVQNLLSKALASPAAIKITAPRLISPGVSSWGTTANPKIVVLEGAGDITMTTNVHGHGILILRSDGLGMTMNLPSNFRFTGLVILVPRNGSKVELNDKACFAGGMWFVNPDGGNARTKLNDRTDAYYSSAGITEAFGAVTGAGISLGGGLPTIRRVATRGF